MPAGEKCCALRVVYKEFGAISMDAAGGLLSTNQIIKVEPV